MVTKFCNDFKTALIIEIQLTVHYLRVNHEPMRSDKKQGGSPTKH